MTVADRGLPKNEGLLPLEALLTSLVAGQREIAAAGPGIAQVASTLASVAHRLTRRRAFVLLLDEDAFEAVGAVGPNGWRLSCGLRFPAVPSLSHSSLLADETLVSSCSESDPRVDPALCRRLEIGSHLAVPLRHDGVATVA